MKPNLGEKLRFAQKWYELELLTESADDNITYYECAGNVMDFTESNDLVFQVVKIDLDKFKRYYNSDTLKLLIEYYEEYRNDLLNQILGSY